MFHLLLAEGCVHDDGDTVELGDIQAVVIKTVLCLDLLAPCNQQEAEYDMYSLTSHLLPLTSQSVLDFINDVHNVLQLVLIGERDADLSLALGRAGHLYLHLEEV